MNSKMIVKNKDYEDVIQSFKNIIDDFDSNLEILRKEWDLEDDNKYDEFYHFIEYFLPDYCVKKNKEEKFDVIKKIFDNIENILINYPNSQIENYIGVCFLESLWGNFYEFHEKYIEFSGKKTLELTMEINWIFYHKEESNGKILKKLEKM